MKIKREILLTLILAASIFSVTILFTLPRAHTLPQADTKMRITPAINTYYNSTTPPGSTITINITVVNVTNLFSWQFNVSWNPAYLNFSSASLPSDHVFAASGGFYEVGPDVGTSSIVYAAVLNNVIRNTFNGTGTLAQLTLTVLNNLDAIPSDIEFRNAPPAAPADCVLQDRTGADIAFDVEDGVYNYLPVYYVTHTVTSGTTNYNLETWSNGTIIQNGITYTASNYTIAFNVTGTVGDYAFVNVSIPKSLMTKPTTGWKVYINGTQVSSGVQDTSNTTYSFVYFPLQISAIPASVQGIPEFSSAFFMLLAVSSAVAVAAKVKTKKKY